MIEVCFTNSAPNKRPPSNADNTRHIWGVDVISDYRSNDMCCAQWIAPSYIYGYETRPLRVGDLKKPAVLDDRYLYSLHRVKR